MRLNPSFCVIWGLLLCLHVFRIQAEVELYLVEREGLVDLHYRCTAGEQVRFFHVDVQVARGQITAVTPALKGESTAATPGYGIFPAAFRDHLTIDAQGQVNWSHADYLPVAPQADAPDNTLPGLGSSGVTLELGALWNVNRPDDAPLSEGLLCTLTLNEPTLISISENSFRGGVVVAESDPAPTVVIQMLDLTPPKVLDMQLQTGTFTLNFEGGELMEAESPEGPWTPTGNTSGSYVVSPFTHDKRFFRVRKP